MLKLVERELRAAREKTTETLRQMTRLHELGARLISTGDLRSMLVEVLRAAMDITGVDMGHVQECDDAGVLTITAHLGFEQLFLEHFARVEAHTDSACDTSIAGRQRVIVEDVTTSAVFKGSRSLQVMRAAGVQAVQTTPLFDRSGRLLGMLSTHYRTPHRFEDDELRWLDVLALFAADVIERGQAEGVLARSHRELERRVAERTKWLTLMHAISVAINESTTWDDASAAGVAPPVRSRALADRAHLPPRSGRRRHDHRHCRMGGPAALSALSCRDLGPTLSQRTEPARARLRRGPPRVGERTTGAARAAAVQRGPRGATEPRVRGRHARQVRARRRRRARAVLGSAASADRAVPRS